MINIHVYDSFLILFYNSFIISSLYITCYCVIKIMFFKFFVFQCIRLYLNIAVNSCRWEKVAWWKIWESLFDMIYQGLHCVCDLITGCKKFVIYFRIFFPPLDNYAACCQMKQLNLTEVSLLNVVTFLGYTRGFSQKISQDKLYIL